MAKIKLLNTIQGSLKMKSFYLCKTRGFMYFLFIKLLCCVLLNWNFNLIIQPIKLWFLFILLKKKCLRRWSGVCKGLTRLYIKSKVNFAHCRTFKFVRNFTFFQMVDTKLKRVLLHQKTLNWKKTSKFKNASVNNHHFVMNIPVKMIFVAFHLAYNSLQFV